MTRYAFDSQDQKLIATWGTGQGDRAVTVAALDPSVGKVHGLTLAHAMNILADFLWRAYTKPASDIDDGEDHNSPAWRRARTRESFDAVPDAITKPHLPDERGMMFVSYEPILESAHRLGRLLHEIADAGLVETVNTEFAEEIDAIERAERGDLRDRAQQAVLLSRPEASPAQVAAADAILREVPLGSGDLFTSIDPTAAAVAAAHWLHAAALVAGERSGIHPANVVRVADDIQALPFHTPTLILEHLTEDHSPYSVVVSLIRDASVVASGFVPNVEAYLDQIEEAETEAAEYTGPDQEYLRKALLHGIRLTPLDPSRASLDLLEDLLSGIDGCWMIFKEYTNAEDLYSNEDDEEEDCEVDDEAYTAWYQSTLTEFRELVRQQAQSMHLGLD